MPKNISLADDDDDNLEKPLKKSIENAKAKKKSNMDATRRILGEIVDNGKWWKPASGKNTLRILPPWAEEKPWLFPSYLHYGFQIDGKGRAFPCLAKAFKKTCPVCQMIAMFSREEDEDVQRIMKDVQARSSYLMNIIDRKEEHPTPRIYNATPPVARDIKNALFGDEDLGDITDPETGRDIVVTKEGEGKKSRYSANIKVKPSPIAVEDWEDNLWNLEDEAYREIPSYAKYCEYITECFSDIISDVDKAFTKPIKNKITGKEKPKVRPYDPTEDELEDL